MAVNLLRRSVLVGSAALPLAWLERVRAHASDAVAALAGDAAAPGQGKPSSSASPRDARAASSAGTVSPPDAWAQFRGSSALNGVAGSSLPDALKQLWSYEAEETIDSSPAIADGSVFVGTESGLLALSLDKGTLLWKHAMTGGVGESTPTVGRGLVLVGGLSGELHAVDVKTGKPAWTYKTETEIKSSPVVVGDRVLIGSYDANLYALDITKGTLIWKAETDNYIHGTPAVIDGVAYFAGCDEILRGIRVADGKEVVSFSVGSYTGASLAVAWPRAYFGTFDNEILGVDIAAKKVLWRFVDPDRHFPFYSSAALANGIAVVGGRDKMVHAIDTATGTRTWKFTAQARIDSSPVVVGQRLFIGSFDGRLYALDVKTGKEIWQVNLGSGISSSPAVAANRLVIASQDGRVVAFG